MKKIKYLSLIMIMILVLTGCGGKEIPSNNQQEEQINNQEKEQIKKESPLTKIKEKLEKKDFSDIAGTYELVKFDDETGDYYKNYNNFDVQKLVIDKDGNIYKYPPYTGDTSFPITEIRENTYWNYLTLENKYYDTISVYPAGFECKEDADVYTPENWNNKSKNRIWAYFSEFAGKHNLYYIQVD